MITIGPSAKLTRIEMAFKAIAAPLKPWRPPKPSGLRIFMDQIPPLTSAAVRVRFTEQDVAMPASIFRKS